MIMDSIKGISLNVRGLKNETKRCYIFKWLNNKKVDFCFIQEAHSEKQYEAKWRLQSKYDIIFSHGTNNSAGVAILITREKDIEILQEERDASGRIVLVRIKHNNEQEYTLVNVYAPTKTSVNTQLQFLEALYIMLENHQGENLIMGGDWNTIIDNKKDKRGGVLEQYTKYQLQLKQFIRFHHLVDVWRVQNPDKTIFTWRQNLPYLETRLDYWLILEFLGLTTKSKILPDKVKTDHKPIEITISLSNNTQRGPGYWKFNCQLLYDDHYTEKIKTLIAEKKQEYELMEDKGLKWDIIKCKLRSFTITYEKKKKQNHSAHVKLLHKQQQELTDILDEYPQNVYVHERLRNVQQEIENILTLRN